MDVSEATGLVWEALAKAGKACSSMELADATCLEAGEVRRAVAVLRENKLVEVDVDKGTPLFSYALVRQLDALGWARAVEVGVPLSILEAHAKLGSGVRDEALRLALAGRLDAMRSEARGEKLRERALAIEGRVASRVAATDLAQLVSDTRAAASIGRFRPVEGAAPSHAGEPPAARKGRGRSSRAPLPVAQLHSVPIALMSPSERAVQEVLERAQEEANRALGTLLVHLRGSGA